MECGKQNGRELKDVLKRSLKEILAPMSPKEKIAYIWDYYRWIIIGFIVLIVIIGFSVKDLAGQKENALSIVLISNQADPNVVEEFERNLNELLISKEDQDSLQVNIRHMYYNIGKNGETQLDPNNTQVLFTYLAAQEVDIIIQPMDQYHNLNSQESFLNIEEIVGTGELPVGEESLQSSQDQNQITGIGVGEISILNELNLEEGNVLSVFINSPNMEYVSKFINYMLNNQ